MSELTYTPEIKEEPTPSQDLIEIRDKEVDPSCCTCPPDPDGGIIKCPTVT